MVEKKTIKLGAAALAVVALVVGVSVGVSQSQKNRNDVSSAMANAMPDVDYCDEPTASKAGKSGGRRERQRRLVVPGTEDYQKGGDRRSIRRREYFCPFVKC